MTDGAPGDRPRILVIGATGQIGWELARVLSHQARVVSPSRCDLDLEDPEGLRESVREIRPDWVVNAAAYTDVEGAEADRERAFAVNAVAPGALAEEAARLGAGMVHFSTDYVFDGLASEPYTEDAPPAPLNAYGESKRAGELAVLSAGCPSLVFRTSWVYGMRRSNFLLTVLRLARDPGRVIRVVDDQTGAPTHAGEVARATAAVLAQVGVGDIGRLHPDRTGIFNMSAGGETSWFDFARAIVSLDPRRQEHRYEALSPVSTDERPSRAERPRYSVLGNERLERTFAVRLPSWRRQLERALEPVDHPRDPRRPSHRGVAATAWRPRG